MIEIRWHGRGGQGAFTASKIVGEAVALYSSQHALAFPSFGPERRGAPVLAFTKIAPEKIQNRSEVKLCDYIVILDETLFQDSFFNDLKTGGRIILNSSDSSKYNAYGTENLVRIDATAIALEIIGKPITNTAMIGALSGVCDAVSHDAVLNAVGHYFKDDLLQKNKEVISRTFEISNSLMAL